jgi:uncharacterized delta-60 repeat protein
MDELKRWMVSLLAVVLTTLAFAGTGLAATAGVFDPNVNGTVKAIVVQPDGKILVGGYFSEVGGATFSANIVRLNTDGTVDTTFTPQITGGDFETIALQADGKILIGGRFSQVGAYTRDNLARLNANGTVDTTFSNPVVNSTGTLGSVFVYSIAVQPDGQILIGGYFSEVGGAARLGIARLNSNGAVDTSFNAVLDSAGVYAIALQTDGKIVIGGSFAVGTASGIARLNTNGSLDTSFNPPATDYDVYAIALQANGSIVIGGGFSNVGTTARSGVARLSVTGSLDPSFDPNAGGSTGTTPGVNAVALQPDGKIVIGGLFTTVGGVNHSHVARLNTNGTPDTTFAAAVNTGSNSWVSALAVQGDGGILVGGNFSTVNGYARNNMARFEPDGSVINGFNPIVDNTVWSTALQPDGMILIGGAFSFANGTPRTFFARLDANGALDIGFDPRIDPLANGKVLAISVLDDGRILIGGSFTSFTVTVNNIDTTVTRNRLARLNGNGTLDSGFSPGFNNQVGGLAVQPDGKILVVGAFTSFTGMVNGSNATVIRNRIARLNPDGSLDAAFNPGFDAPVYLATLQTDGKILVGGMFTKFTGTINGGSGSAPTGHIARLNADGSLDTTFTDPNATNTVYAIKLQPNGQILVSGLFTAIAGDTNYKYLARLNTNGTLEGQFNPKPDATVDDIVLQTDGGIIIGGAFTHLGTSSAAKNRVARINGDGSLDSSFTAGVDDNAIISVREQADGKVLIGGTFTTVGGVPHAYLARLSNSAVPTQSLSTAADGTSLTWLRGGVGPEVDRSTLEFSSDLSAWSMLGSGMRTGGGWQLNGLTLPIGKQFSIRARGDVQGGYCGSRSLFETVQTFCLTSLSPVATAGTSVSQTGFTANWNASVGAAGYRFDVANDSGFTSLVAGYNNPDAGNVTSYAVSGLTPGSTYYVRVRAYNLCGTSGNSNTITVILPPANPVATAASGIGRTGLTATWNGSAGATGYRFDVATDSGFASFVPGYNNLGVGNTTSNPVTGLTPGTTYYYRVRAYNPGGTSGNSNTVTVTTNATLNLTIGGSGSGTVNSNPAGIACAKGSGAGCSGEFAGNSTVNLTATPDWRSLPGVFSGGGSGTGSCGVLMLNGDKGVSVTFSPNYQVRATGATPTDYAAIQDAYNGASSGSTIMAQVYAFYENLVFGRGITVTLDGGKDGTYQATSGYTTVQGSFTIGQGAVVVNRVIIR